MKEHERKELEELKELRKTIEASPLTKQIQAEQAAAVLAKRTDAAGKIEVLKTEGDALIPKLLADLEAKEAKYKKAKTALDVAAGEYNAARYALSSENNNLANAISREEQILIESADPQIDDAIVFFKEKLDWLRAPGRISRNAVGAERNIFTEKITITEESNAAAIRDALSYCMAAIKGLERLKLSPVLDLQKIEILKKGIPDIIYTESTGERAMEKGPSGAFLARMSNEFDEKINKLLGKRA